MVQVLSTKKQYPDHEEEFHSRQRLCQKLNSPHGSVEMFQIFSMRPTLDPLPRALRAGGNESCFSVERI